MILRIKREVITSDEFGENLEKLPVLLQGIVLTMYVNKPEMRKIAKERGSKGVKALEQMEELERIIQEIPSEIKENYDIRTREQLEELVFTKVTEFEVTKEVFDELCRVFRIYNVAFKTMKGGIEIDLRQEKKK